jgi:hypothetical protein
MSTATMHRASERRVSREDLPPPRPEAGQSVVATALTALFGVAVFVFAEAGYINQGGWWVIGAAVLALAGVWALWDHLRRTR